jgi:hypothetical protein
MITISYIVATYPPDYIITIMVEIESKNGAGNIYIHAYLEKLPYMVSLIVKRTPPLNSHRKTGPEHISYVPY